MSPLSPLCLECLRGRLGGGIGVIGKEAVKMTGAVDILLALGVFPVSLRALILIPESLGPLLRTSEPCPASPSSPSSSLRRISGQ